MPVTDAALNYWAWKAEVHEKVANRVKDDEGWRGRAAQPHSAGWGQYNPTVAKVMVRDAWGKERWITPTQARVLNAARTIQSASMGKIAASLGVVTSTVYRALLRLASMGLVAYDTKRGRSGGVTFVQLAGKALEERAQKAWETLKAARMRAAERWSQRLIESGYPSWALIVAPIEAWTQHLDMKAPFTVEDMADAGLM